MNYALVRFMVRAMQTICRAQPYGPIRAKMNGWLERAELDGDGLDLSLPLRFTYDRLVKAAGPPALVGRSGSKWRNFLCELDGFDPTRQRIGDDDAECRKHLPITMTLVDVLGLFARISTIENGRIYLPTPQDTLALELIADWRARMAQISRHRRHLAAVFVTRQCSAPTASSAISHTTTGSGTALQVIHHEASIAARQSTIASVGCASCVRASTEVAKAVPCTPMERASGKCITVNVQTADGVVNQCASCVRASTEVAKAVPCPPMERVSGKSITVNVEEEDVVVNELRVLLLEMLKVPALVALVGRLVTPDFSNIVAYEAAELARNVDIASVALRTAIWSPALVQGDASPLARPARAAESEAAPLPAPVSWEPVSMLHALANRRARIADELTNRLYVAMGANSCEPRSAREQFAAALLKFPPLEQSWRDEGTQIRTGLFQSDQHASPLPALTNDPNCASRHSSASRHSCASLPLGDPPAAAAAGAAGEHTRCAFGQVEQGAKAAASATKDDGYESPSFSCRDPGWVALVALTEAFSVAVTRFLTGRPAGHSFDSWITTAPWLRSGILGSLCLSAGPLLGIRRCGTYPLLLDAVAALVTAEHLLVFQHP
jgi:hypothetical protein